MWVMDGNTVGVGELTIWQPIDGEKDVFRGFDAPVELDDSDEDDHPRVIGEVQGYIGWNMIGEDIWDAGDAIDADAEVLAAAAQGIASWMASEQGVLVEAVLMIDRVTLHKEHRGHGRLRAVVEGLLAALRLEREATIVVTQPEPQQDEGGPYPYGPVRDSTLSRLCGSLEATGFERWRQTAVYWLPNTQQS